MFNLSIKMLKDDVLSKDLFYPYARGQEVLIALHSNTIH